MSKKTSVRASVTGTRAGPATANHSPRTSKYKLMFGNGGLLKDLPSVTISGTRKRELWDINDSPGPGSYEPRQRDNRMQHKITGGPAKARESITAHIDFFDHRQNQWRKPITHEPAASVKHEHIDQTPGPSYVPPSTLCPTQIRIKSYYPSHKNETISPGPGAYAPRYDLSCARQPSFSISDPANRSDWLIAEKTPAVGKYSPPSINPKSSKEPSWTIGDRSRGKRFLKRSESNTPSITLERFVVRVPESEYDWAFRKIQNDVDLRQLFEWVMDQVMFEKPNDPVELFRRCFEIIRHRESINEE